MRLENTLQNWSEEKRCLKSEGETGWPVLNAPGDEASGDAEKGLLIKLINDSVQASKSF